MTSNNMFWMAQVSHELKTPLNSIVGIISLLEETDLDEEQYEYTTIIKKSSKDLLKLVSHILDYAKLESNKMVLKNKKIRIRKIIDDVYNSFIFKFSEKNVNFEIEYDDNIPKYLYCDSLRIKQILYNLISNSIKFTNFGFVKVISKLISKDEKRCIIELSVKDTGVGIQKNKLNCVFTPFHQCHRNGSNIGTGLGLSICKKICELMNGDLKIKSNQNGTTVSCKLTFDYDFDKNKEEKKIKLLKNKKILIVDPDPSKRLNIASILFEYEMKVLGLHSIEDIDEYIKKHTFDLIFVNQCEFSQEIVKKFNNNVKFLLIRDNKKEIIKYENIQYIYKPFNEKYIIDILLSIFGKIICESSYNRFLNNPSKFYLNSKFDINILIVDDVFDNQVVLYKLLKKFGYKNIESCENGKKCLEILKKKKIDLIFLDIIMPIMDGKETIKHIQKMDTKKELKKKPKICVMTANVMNDMKDGKSYDFYIEKPIKISYLKKVLQKI